MTALDIFRLVASEFSEISDTTVLQWIELSKPLVSQKIFKKLYLQALALLTAHRMKLANVGVNTAETSSMLLGVGGVGGVLGVASYSEGETSISFNADLKTTPATEAEYALTEYGIQYLQLRRLVIIPIRSAGEARC